MTEVRVLAEGLGSPEGPDFLPDGRAIFVETFLYRVSVWDPETGVRAYADVGGAPTSCIRGLDGVYVAQNGRTGGPWRSPQPCPPSIQRIADDGTVEVVADTASGVPLIGPNDLAFGPDGSLYFTDPGTYDPEHPEEGRVCRVDPDGACTILEEVGHGYPNGIVVESDGAVVWTESYTRRIRRRAADGGVETVATLPADRILDGLKIAADGNLYVAGVTSGGIDVVAPDGALVDFVAVGGVPLNCVFRGSELYITDYGDGPDEGDAVMCGRLKCVDVGVEGRDPYWGAIASPR